MTKRILLYITIGLLFFGCGPGKVDVPVEEKPSAEEAGETTPPPVQAAPVELAAETEGLAVFVAGDVLIRREGSEDYLR